MRKGVNSVNDCRFATMDYYRITWLHISVQIYIYKRVKSGGVIQDNCTNKVLSLAEGKVLGIQTLSEPNGKKLNNYLAVKGGQLTR